MKQPAKLALLAGAVLALPSCSVAVTQAGRTVRVTENPEVVRDCKFLGTVRASDRLNGGLLGQDIADRNVETRLQNSTAELGGDTVLMKMHSSGTDGASGRGEAYRCGPAGSSTPTPSPTPTL